MSLDGVEEGEAGGGRGRQQVGLQGREAETEHGEDSQHLNRKYWQLITSFEGAQKGANVTCRY